MGGFLWTSSNENHKKVLSQGHNENPQKTSMKTFIFNSVWSDKNPLKVVQAVKALSSHLLRLVSS